MFNSLLYEDLEGVNVPPSVPRWGAVVCLFVVVPKHHASCSRKIVCIVLRRMVSLEFVPFVWEMACSRCVDFVGLVVLVVVCAVMVAVR